MNQDSLLKHAKKLLSRAKEISKEKGIHYVIYGGIRRIINCSKKSFWLYYYKVFKSRTFMFDGQPFRSFYHKHNTTWKNERVVEIPIVWKIVKKYRGKKILEVGNVLSHYFRVNHDILDKYEKANGIINQDVAYFQSNNKYDLIVSISTLEHVGWDEEKWAIHEHRQQTTQSAAKIIRSIENLKRLLSPEGKIVVTLPLGYNLELDKLLQNKEVKFARMHCLKRISMDNKWIEVDWKDVQNSRFNSPFPAANGLVIGIIEKDTTENFFDKHY